MTLTVKPRRLVPEPSEQHSKRSPLAGNLRKARRAKDLTQEQVAAAVGVHPVTVSKWERGLFAPDDEQLQQLARVFGESPASLRYGGDAESTASFDISQLMSAGEAERVLRSHRVRVWLAEFRAELTKAMATEEEIERALALVSSPSVLTFYSRGQVRALTEDDAVLALDAIAMPIRSELRRRGRRFK